MGNANVGQGNVAQRQRTNARKERQARGYAAFTERQRKRLTLRYRHFDPKGSEGIPVDVCLAMPEFCDNKLVSILIYDFVNSDTGCISQEEFLRFCSFLSPNTSPEEKKKALFESFNVYQTEVFTHDEIFRLFKVLLNHTVSDDHILALTFKTLDHPSLAQRGQMTKQEFIKMIPDSEIEEKLTVFFNVPFK